MPLLICLEGGYSLAALARSVVATLDAISGDGDPREAPIEPAAPYRERLARFWPVWRPRSAELLLGPRDLGGQAHQEIGIDLAPLVHLQGDRAEAEKLGVVLLL